MKCRIRTRPRVFDPKGGSRSIWSEGYTVTWRVQLGDDDDAARQQPLILRLYYELNPKP
jgi:hypothetical protein